jgi:hypothetical protein
VVGRVRGVGLCAIFDGGYGVLRFGAAGFVVALVEALQDELCDVFLVECQCLPCYTKPSPTYFLGGDVFLDPLL